MYAIFRPSDISKTCVYISVSGGYTCTVSLILSTLLKFICAMKVTYALTHVARVVETDEETIGYLTEIYTTPSILNADHSGRPV
jgi:hypothetical protein